MKNDKGLELWNKAAKRFIKQQDENVLYNELLKPKLSKLLHSRSFSSAMDAGCGTGAVSNEMWKLGATVEAFDPVADFISIAKMDFKGPNFTVGGFDTIYDSKFDVITCVNVLNNISSLEKPTAFFDKYCSNGGELIISIEHPFYTERKTSDDSRYSDEFRYTSTFLGSDVPIHGWHRSLERFCSYFFQYNFVIQQLHEISATPEDENIFQKFGSGPFFMIIILTR